MKRFIVFFVLIMFAVTALPAVRVNTVKHEKELLSNDKNHVRGNHIVKHGANKIDLPEIRSASAVKLRYDSLVCWDVDVANNLIYDYKDIFKFNNNGNVYEYYYYLWDKTESDWVCWEYQIYTYDTKGNVIQTLSYEYDDSLQVLLPDFKKEYTYNNKQKVSYTLSYWSENLKTWEKTWKDDYTYDTNGKNTVILEYKWNTSSSSWQYNWKQQNTFDSNGNQTNLIEYYWNSYNSNWYEYSKTETTYDAYGNLAIEIDYDWNDSLQTVVPTYKDFYNTDNFGYTITDYEYVWNLKTSDWDLDWKGEYFFDNKWNPTKEEYYWLDSYTKSFYNYSRYEYSYNMSYNLTDICKSPFFTPYPDFNEKVVNIPTEYKKFYINNDTKNLDQTRKALYYYSEFNVSSTDKPDIDKVRVFPNPVSNQLIISVPGNSTQFDLYDLQGRKIMSETLNGSGIVNMNDLTKGIYLYKIYVDGIPETGKLIKE